MLEQILSSRNCFMMQNRFSNGSTKLGQKVSSNSWCHLCPPDRVAGITVPIIPGVMPIQTYSSFLRLIKLCGVKVPPTVMAALEPICVNTPIINHITLLIRGQHDDQLVKGYGVGLAVDIIRKITSTGKIKGIHFCTLNLEKSVQLVIEKLQWADGSPTMKNRLIAASLVNLSLRSSS